MSAPSRPAWLAGQPVSRRRLRRLSRDLAAVGVGLPPARLRRIAAGDPPTAAELVDITFAELATTMKRDNRRTKRVRAQRYCMHCAVVLIAVLVALGVLIGLGLAFFALAARSF